MGINWTVVAIATVLLAAIAPWVVWVRHPRQQPFIAYITFVCVFAVTAVVLFVLLGWLVDALGLTTVLGRWGLALLLLLLGVLPSFILATWQARRPPSS